jgi:hypothetical protein
VSDPFGGLGLGGDGGVDLPDPTDDPTRATVMQATVRAYLAVRGEPVPAASDAYRPGEVPLATSVERAVRRFLVRTLDDADPAAAPEDAHGDGVQIGPYEALAADLAAARTGDPEGDALDDEVYETVVRALEGAAADHAGEEAARKARLTAATTLLNRVEGSASTASVAFPAASNRPPSAADLADWVDDDGAGGGGGADGR